MLNSRIKLYTTLFVACIAGYMWLFYGITRLQSVNTSVELCLIKHTTNIPCPSCGSTRAILSLMHGDFLQSMFINPFGIISACIMIITPFWILFDLTIGKSSLLNFYRHTEDFLKKPKVAIPLVMFVLFNWIWNITKGL